MAEKEGPYASDRWLTPGVIITLMLISGIVVTVTIASVTYLTARGIDAAPIVSLVGILLTTATTAMHFVMGLAGRTTSAKIERNTGQLVSGVGVVAETLGVPATTPIGRALPKLPTEINSNG